MKAKERLCDVAATELLMPELIFRKYLTNFGVSIYAIERLANVFGVSTQAAVARIAEVSEEPCIALFWKLQGTNPNAFKLWWQVGPRRNSGSKAYYAPVNKTVKYPSVLHKAYEHDSPVKCYRFFKQGTEVRRLPMESKAFGRGENRYVASLAFVDKIKS